MKTTNRPFQLEDNIPGIFLLQGLFGGAFGGFTYVVAVCLWSGTAYFDWVIIGTPFYMVAGVIIGVIKATIMWGIYRLTGIRMGALARVAVSSIGACLVAFLLNESNNGTELPNWLILTLSPAIPTALLVGSNVKPWELFTFGSIVVNGCRVGSRSVLATLGTLPLRFLSLIALAVWVLLYSCRRPYSAPATSLELEIVTFLLPAIYFALSAYLTFRSPTKAFIPVWAVLLNLYAGGYFFVFFYQSYSNGRWPGDEDWLLSVTARAFIVAWNIFLVARLGAPTNEAKPLTILPPAQIRPKVIEHQCLGMRFVEWQKRVA